MNRNDPFGTGTGGGTSPEPEQGTARVETRLTGAQGSDTPDRGGAGGGSDASAMGRAGEMLDQATDRARDVASGARNRIGELGHEAQDQVREWGDQAREQVDGLTEQARGLASRARDEVSGALERAEDRLEEQTGAVTFVRENPLLSAGLAFGVGFLLAGDGGSGRKKRSGLMGRASGSLRSAVVGGVSTMLMQELQDLMDEHGGPAGLLSAITGRGSGDDEHQERPRGQG